MTAKQAREIAHQRNVFLNDSQYKEIVDMIYNAADGGAYEVFYYKTIKPDVKHKLVVEDGFIVSDTQFERDGTCITKISWKLPKWHLTPIY